MMGMKVKFVSGLARWLNRLPVKLKGAEKQLQAAAMREAPEAQTEGQAAVIAAMGWDGADWQREVAKQVEQL